MKEVNQRSPPDQGAREGVLLIDACGTVNVHRPVGNPKRKV
jgi:hypothetical protein